MKTVKSDTVQFVMMEEGERLKTFHLMSLTGTGWQGNLLMEVVKASAGAWPTGNNDKHGDPVWRMASPDEIVQRATRIVQLAVAEMDNHGWSVAMLPAEEMIDEGGKVGFTRGVGNGKGQAGEPLPRDRDPASPIGRGL